VQLHDHCERFDGRLWLVGMGTAAHARAFKEETGVDFPVLLSRDKAAYQAMDLRRGSTADLLSPRALGATLAALGANAAWPLTKEGAAAARDDRVVIGQTAPLSGPVADAFKGVLAGEKMAFEQINRDFAKIFERLFEGGRAELRLVEAEEGGDPLDTGVDLMAQPRGKRLQSVTLLSGGERALTGLALLFAIFYFRPSPFCVLDEVDAPLDDANIHRFLRVLRELTSQTQFLVITHNRRTMEAADVLYGVTMEEPGLSKLVSVNLNPDE